jgi:Flp pilus assembly secretin CpaC
MKKPPSRLALSVTVALLQASLLQASAAPASPSIWQQLSGAAAEGKGAVAGKKVVKKAPHVVRATTSVAKKVAPAVTAQGVAASGMNGQVVLFLGKGKDAGVSGTQAPAAALTIHTALPETETVAEVATEASTEAPTLVAMNTPATSMPSSEKVVTDSEPPADIAPDAVSSTSLASNKQLLAQLAPDQIVAQAQSDTAVTPIPPVVSGTVDLEEFKPSNAIDLRVSQSRTFKLRNKIIRTSISDPSIAEPVVVAENQMVLLGKAPGVATLVIWDDAGNSVAVDVRVTHDYTQLQSMLREIDPRIIVRPFAVGGSDRVILTGDVDHPESVIRAFAVANAFMDDRGMNITVANNRILGARLGEIGGTQAGAGASGQLSNIGNVDRYSFFGNQMNNITKAQTILSDGGRVTGLIRVRKAPLIVLHCTFIEMNSSAARQIGAQLGFSYSNENFGFAIGGTNSVAGQGQGQSPFLFQTLGGINGGPPGSFPPPGPGSVLPTVFQNVNGITINPGAAGAPGTVTVTAVPSALGTGALLGPPGLLQLANLFGIPGGAGFTTAGLASLFTGTSVITNHNQGGRFSINPTLQGIMAHNRARVLAEPTVVTESGERAAFLVGGEIPILQSIAAAGTAAQSVSFEPFGLRLNCIPVLEENGAINLQVAPEERLVSAALGNNILGAGTGNVPGFVTRRFQTTVELRPGQELFIAGLVSANHGREVDKLPVLGELPVIGALYRSKAFSKNESELVVAVRPEIILPGTPGQLKLPEEISKVEGPRDTNFLQVEPTILDERYMRTGRAEKTLQLPGVLPPDAPIPDNK